MGVEPIQILLISLVRHVFVNSLGSPQTETKIPYFSRAKQLVRISFSSLSQVYLIMGRRCSVRYLPHYLGSDYQNTLPDSKFYGICYCYHVLLLLSGKELAVPQLSNDEKNHKKLQLPKRIWWHS